MSYTNILIMQYINTIMCVITRRKSNSTFLIIKDVKSIQLHNT